MASTIQLKGDSERSETDDDGAHFDPGWNPLHFIPTPARLYETNTDQSPHSFHSP